MIYIIAEVGINHNGDMKLAHWLIKEAAAAKCNAVKFQKRDIELVYSKKELDKQRESPWGTTNREQKEGLEFNIEQHKQLEAYTKSLGMDYIVSCWDLNSLDEVESNLHVKFHKIASAMICDKQFLNAINKTDKKVIMSTGMSTMQEIYKSAQCLHNLEYILACTATYPTKPEHINLKVIETYRRIFPGIKIGFSNHYNGHDACIGAVALGAKCIEFHITRDRAMYGSDQAASIEHISKLVEGIKKMDVMRGDGKKVIYEEEKPILDKLRKVNSWG